MSVINQMLRDLEARQASGEQENIYRPQPAAGRRIGWWVGGVLALLLVAGGLAWQLGYLGRPVPASPVTATLVPPVVAAAEAVIPEADKAVVAPPVTQDETATADPQPVALQGAPQAMPAEPESSQSEATVPVRSSLPAPLPEEEPLFVDEDTLQQPVGEPSERLAATGALQAADAYPDEAAYEAPAPQSSLKIEPVQLSPEQQAQLDQRLARQAMASGNLAKAREALDRVVRAMPMDHDSRAQLAGLLYGEGRLTEARQLLEQGMALAPNYANFRLLLARLAQAMGDKPGALAYLQGLTPPVAANLDYYATRAALAQELGSPAEAVLSYQHLTQAQPANGRWWMGLGISLDKQGQPSQAIAAYRQALARGQLGDVSRQFVRQRLTQLEQ